MGTKKEPQPGDIEWEIENLHLLCGLCAEIEDAFLALADQDDEALGRMRSYLSDRFDFIVAP